MQAASTQESLKALQRRFEDALAAWLRRKHLVTEAELEEALTQQVIMGGHLATNLWELGIVPGKTLQQASAGLLRKPSVEPGKLAKTPPDVLRRLDRGLVQQGRLIPFSVEGKTLHVATCEPWNLTAIDAAGFHSGLRIEIHFVAEVPLVRLLEKLYGIPASARFRLPPQVRIRETAANEVEDPTVGEDLMGEETFEAMYAEIDTLGESVAPAGGSDETAELEIIELVDEVEAAAETEALTPLDWNAAVALLREAPDRDAVGLALARVALGAAPRMVLFSHQRDIWLGWTGAGPGITAAAVRGLMIPSQPGTLFGTVKQLGSHMMGPPAKHPIHDRLFDALGGVKPGTVGLFPVWHKGRIAMGIYLDAGANGRVSHDIGDLLIVGQHVPQTLDRLVQSRGG